MIYQYTKVQHTGSLPTPTPTVQTSNHTPKRTALIANANSACSKL